jgi:hypothetical protein
MIERMWNVRRKIVSCVDVQVLQLLLLQIARRYSQHSDMHLRLNSKSFNQGLNVTVCSMPSHFCRRTSGGLGTKACGLLTETMET